MFESCFFVCFFCFFLLEKGICMQKWCLKSSATERDLLYRRWQRRRLVRRGSRGLFGSLSKVFSRSHSPTIAAAARRRPLNKWNAILITDGSLEPPSSAATYRLHHKSPLHLQRRAIDTGGYLWRADMLLVGQINVIQISLVREVPVNDSLN